MNTKRIVGIILASCLMSLSVLALSTTTVKKLGDVNCNGKVDVADIASVISVMTSEVGHASQRDAADVNGDGKVDVADITAIISIMAGDVEADPVPARTAHVGTGPGWWGSLDTMCNGLYACATGDTILVQWSYVENSILEILKEQGISITKEEFEAAYKVDEKLDRWGNPCPYGSLVFLPEADRLGVGFQASEMLEMLSQRNENGESLDTLGNVTENYCDRAFLPYADDWVRVRLSATGHEDWPDMWVTFRVEINQNKATMSRPSRMNNGCWYARGGSNNSNIINANVDAYANGTYPHDVRRLLVNTQKVLDGQRWVPSNDMQGAFNFSFDKIWEYPEGDFGVGCRGIERSKLKELHGDLYFYTNDWLGDVEEGTPYWHDANNTESPLDDRFYANRYLIKACYTNEPLDTVKGDGGKLGKYLFAYKYNETKGTYDMAGGQMIAYIDNLDTRSSDMGTTASANVDADGRPNEDVNVHFNWESTFMRDLLNRAGRYAGTNSGTQDGYSKDTDNSFIAHVHLNLMEKMMGANDAIPIILENPDFCIRPLRPISVEFSTPWQNVAINGDSRDGEKLSITYTEMFRNQSGWPSRIFPMDWRGYTNIRSVSAWIGFYQGFNDGKDNLWSTNTSESSLSWNGDNVVPDIAHMLTNYGGKEVLLESCASEVPIVMTHTYNDNGNIETTTFEYASGGKAHEAFDILIPVTVKYVWGDITTTGEWMQTTDLPNTDEQYFHQSNMNYVRVHFNATE